LRTTSSIPRLQLILTATLFSTGGAVIKSVAFNTWQVASLRCGLAALALLLLLPGARQIWNRRALLVGLAYAATMILYVAGNKLTTAANTIFLQSTAPFYLLLLGPLLLREPLRRRDVTLGLALAGGMLLFFVGAEPPLRTAPDPFRGNLVAAASGATWALTIFGLRWLARDPRAGAPAQSAVAAGNLIAFLVCLPLAWPLPGGRPIDWVLVSYLGWFQIALAYVLMTRAIRRVPALEVGLLLLLEPVLNALWAWLVHGERPGAWSLAGCSLILLSTLGYVLRRR
jgi:drug/metabolite transporter (DMT)-like permease